MGIILGSGLGGLTSRIEDKTEIPYSKIPFFPKSTVEGHSGSMIFGRMGTREVVVLSGRYHYYEGYSGQQIIYPVRILMMLGVKELYLSNAAGGMNPQFNVGDIMVITDHISLLPNPLIGKHEPEYGERFPDMLHAYDAGLIKKAQAIAKKHKIKLQKGVYMAVTGPTYETPAEYKAFRILGADAVGMSTTPEVIAARQMGLKCFAVSVITDLGVPGKTGKISHKMVLDAARKTEPVLARLFIRLIAGK